MRRGLVLPFPAHRHLTRDDREGLQRFAAALPGIQIDILISRDRRETAILAFAGRHVWIKRDGPRLQARDASSGHLLMEDTCIGGLLAAVQTALMTDGTTIRRQSPAVSQPCASRPASCRRAEP
jgi:hypothetical protein